MRHWNAAPPPDLGGDFPGVRERQFALHLQRFTAFAEPVVPASPPVPCSSGRIDIELPGGVRISVDGGVDAGALARVLSVLR
ncbi:transposase [Sphingomonas pokkalii]|uniref:Transposase n=1 Tax=Sphingomonas pokkalii TaxID=2175090 RepID=A0A2U0SC10_9SPHN|nr:transposase [Sphingomonas pokkalii]PVX28903.1 transposase [Sphingomonas pokkalii]